MTANELANEVMEHYKAESPRGFNVNWMEEAAIMLRQQAELQTLVKSFFEDYLNYEEESDSGRVFNPVHISCTRAMMIEPLAKLLMRMKELSGVKE
jgi:hypothetical protein